MSDTFVRVMSHSQLFHDIELPALEALLKAGTVKKVEAGSILLGEDGRVGGLHVILEGFVEVIKNSQIAVAQLGRGNFFGEISVFGMAPGATASIRAKAGCTLFVVSPSQLKDWFKAYPEAEKLFYRHLAFELCQRLYSTTERIAAL